MNEYVNSHIWGDGSFAHICLKSSGCRFKKSGSCIMCNYGCAENITSEQSIAELNRLQEIWKTPITRILIGTYGSIFDKREISKEVLDTVIAFLADSSINDIIFETHYTTVTTDILNELQTRLPDKHIMIEMGLESADPYVLSHCLNKAINLNAFEKTIKKIQEYHFVPMVNVFLGAPYLSRAEQLQDTLHTIMWANEHGINDIVLFPANIKPNTKLWDMYQEENYHQLSQWMVIEILRCLPDAILENIAVSWYGDRQDKGTALEIIPPADCPQCHDLIQNFYHSFMRTFSAVYRRTLLQQLIKDASCDCYQKTLQILKGDEQFYGDAD